MIKSHSVFYVTLIYYLTLDFSSLAQNLIPNSSFEEFNEDSTLLYWKQPSGKFCHFECKSSQFKYPRSGNCFNGICMYNYQTQNGLESNEYLHIKLIEPLEKGKKYNLKMYARLYEEKQRNAGLLNTISWYFSEEYIPFVIGFNNVVPQVVFSINESEINERNKWMLLEENYIASGYEKFLLIGNFPIGSVFYNKSIDSLSNSQKESEILLSDNLIEKNSDKRNSKKGNRKTKEEVNKQRIEIYKKKKQEDAFRYRNTYDIRYYFDDFYIGLDSTNKDTNQQENIILNIYFETGKDVLLEKSNTELDKWVLFLEKNLALNVIVHGHTDDKGGKDFNHLLSENRAKAVTKYLISKGVNSSRISYKGWGNTKPIADNTTEIGKAKNRRVEFEIIKSKRLKTIPYSTTIF